MDIFSSFQKMAESLIKWLPTVQENNRSLIIETISDITSELTRATNMVLAFLDGVQDYHDNQSIMNHFTNSASKINHTFDEFTVCKGLRILSSKFRSRTSLMKPSIDVKYVQQVEQLINALDDGEKFIYSDLGNSLAKLDHMASDLNPKLEDDDSEQRKNFFEQKMEFKAELEQRRDEIQQASREIMKLI